jgi:hypothetical protein
MVELSNLKKEYPYKFFFKSTLLGKMKKLFDKSDSNDYVSSLRTLNDLTENGLGLHCETPFRKLEAIICFCKDDILYDLWKDKKSSYKSEYPVLHKYLQHCFMVSDIKGNYDKQYYRDFFKPLKWILSKMKGG